MAIDVALVVGLHARREHFDEEALEVGVDNFNLALIRGAGDGGYELCCEIGVWHKAPKLFLMAPLMYIK
jgi:hypothetical protein